MATLNRLASQQPRAVAPGRAVVLEDSSKDSEDAGDFRRVVPKPEGRAAEPPAARQSDPSEEVLRLKQRLAAMAVNPAQRLQQCLENMGADVDWPWAGTQYDARGP